MSESVFELYKEFGLLEASDIHLNGKRLPHLRAFMGEFLADVDAFLSQGLPLIIPIAGDWLHRPIIGDTEADAAEQLSIFKSLGERCATASSSKLIVVAVEGQHDKRAGHESALSALLPFPNVVVVNDLADIDLRPHGFPVIIHALPYLYATERSRNDVIDWLKVVERQVAEAPELYHYFLGHLRLSGYLPVIAEDERELIIQPWLLLDTHCNRFGLGDYHIYEPLTDDRALGGYISTFVEDGFNEGALCVSNAFTRYGSRAGYNSAHIYCQDREWKAVERRVTAPFRYITFQACSKDFIEEVAVSVMKGSLSPRRKLFIRLRLTEGEERPELTLPEGTTVVYEYLPAERADRIRAPEISQAVSPYELYAQYLTATQDTDEGKLLAAAEFLNNIPENGNAARFGQLDRIISLGLVNIHPFDTLHLDLANESVIAFAGANASGKTSALEMICAALYGFWPSRPDYYGQVKDRSKPADITLTFESGGERYRIIRKIKPTKTPSQDAYLEQFTSVDGAEPTWVTLAAPKVSEVEAAVINIVGKAEIFLSTVFASQHGKNDLVTLTAGERKAVLATLIDANRYNYIGDAASAKRGELSLEYAGLQARIEQAARSLETINLKLSGEGETRASYDAKTAELAGLREQLQLLIERNAANEALISGVEGHRANALKCEESLKALDGDILRAKNIVSAAEAAAAKLPELEKQAREDEQRAAEVDTWRSGKLAERREELTLLESRAKKLSALKDAVSSAQRAYDARTRISELELSSNALLIEQAEAAKASIADKSAVGCDSPSAYPPCSVYADTVSRANALQGLLDAREALKTAAADNPHLAEVRSATEAYNAYIKENGDLAERIRLVNEAISTINGKIAELEQWLRRRSSVSAALATARANISAADDARASLTRYEAQRAETTQELTKLVERYGSLAAYYKERELLRTDKTRLEGNLAVAERAVRELDQALGAIEADKAHLSEVAERKEQDEATAAIISGDISRYSHLAEAFGANGVQQLIIEAAVPHLQQLANEITSSLGITAMIAFRTQRETKTGATREALDIIVADENGERDIVTFSGGQRKLLRLAIRLALAAFQAQRAGRRIQVLCLDEVFEALDSANASLVAEGISSISRYFSQVIVITHDPTLVSTFPRIIHFPIGRGE